MSGKAASKKVTPATKTRKVSSMGLKKEPTNKWKKFKRIAHRTIKKPVSFWKKCIRGLCFAPTPEDDENTSCKTLGAGCFGEVSEVAFRSENLYPSEGEEAEDAADEMGGAGYSVEKAGVVASKTINMYSPAVDREIATLKLMSGTKTFPNYVYDNLEPFKKGEEEKPMIGMELIKGITLDALLKALTDRTPIPFGDPNDHAFYNLLMKRLRELLDRIHEKEILHLDFKPDNIMFEPDTTARALDAGASLSFEQFLLEQQSDQFLKYSLRRRSQVFEFYRKAAIMSQPVKPRSDTDRRINSIARTIYTEQARANPKLADYFSLELLRQDIEAAAKIYLGPAFALTPGWAPYTGGYRKSRSKKSKKTSQKR